jgi:hypothetical protein
MKGGQKELSFTIGGLLRAIWQRADEAGGLLIRPAGSKIRLLRAERGSNGAP